MYEWTGRDVQAELGKDSVVAAFLFISFCFAHGLNSTRCRCEWVVQVRLEPEEQIDIQ